MPDYVEEFFLSDAVRNQDRGELQLAFGVDSRHEVGTNTTLKMEYGVAKRLQLSFEMPCGSTEDQASEFAAR